LPYDAYSESMGDVHTVLHYALDASQSKFTVQAFAGGLLAAFGHNPTIAIRDFKGGGTFVPPNMEGASLSLTVNSDSLEVIDKISDKDLREIHRVMRQEVLELAAYPEITFQSTAITPAKIGPAKFKARIQGHLSLHGVTRDLWLQAQVALNGNDLRATGDFSIRQSDYKIKRVKVASGALTLNDELRFVFDVAAHPVPA
jgi:polyisoprenoid-binding protein YceI